MASIRRVLLGLGVFGIAAACGGKIRDLGDGGMNARDAGRDGPMDSGPDTMEAESDVDAGPPPPVVIASSQNAPVRVAVDKDSVYWSNYGTGSGDGALLKADKVTLDQTFLAKNQDPWALLVTGGYVYWTSYGTAGINGDIARIPVAGGNIDVIADGQQYPWSIATDGTNIYWTQQIPMGASVASAPIQSGDASTGFSLACGLFNASGLALHDGILYFTNYDPNEGVFSVPANNAGCPGGVTSLAAAQDRPFAIAVNDTNIYWSTAEAVMTMPVGGGTPSTLAPAAQRIISIALDSKYVYWTDYYANTITEAPLAGGPAIVLAGGQDGAYGLAVDDAWIYWTTYNGGTVMKMPKWP